MSTHLEKGFEAVKFALTPPTGAPAAEATDFVDSFREPRMALLRRMNRTQVPTLFGIGGSGNK